MGARTNRSPRGSKRGIPALLTQDPTERLDRVALGSHGVEEAHGQRLRGVEFPDEESRCPAENLRVFAQPTLLGLECLDLSQRLGRGALALTAVNLGLDHPAAYGLLADAQLLGHDSRSGRERGVLALVILDQPNSSGLQLFIDFLRHVAHPSGLKQERHQTWGASECYLASPESRSTDGLSSYRGYAIPHQLCNAHHLRELTALAENTHQDPDHLADPDGRPPARDEPGGQDRQTQRPDQAAAQPASRVPAPLQIPDRRRLGGAPTATSYRQARPTQARCRRIPGPPPRHLPRRRHQVRHRLLRPLRQQPGRTRHRNDPAPREDPHRMESRTRHRLTGDSGIRVVAT